MGRLVESGEVNGEWGGWLPDNCAQLHNIYDRVP